ncbi:hypothetical protein [Mobilicoccus caccae]|nr:hypothetical protein [Mobilicoccus caccae]
MSTSRGRGRLDPMPPPEGATLTEADGTTYPLAWRPFDDADEPLPLYPCDALATIHPTRPRPSA